MPQSQLCRGGGHFMEDMTAGSPLALILRFSLPLLLGNLLQQAYHLADAAIVGRTLGAAALAAVGSTSSVQFLVTGFCQSLCLGFAIPVGQRFGAGDMRAMHRFEAAGTFLTVLSAFFLTLGTVFSCRQILAALQVPGEIFLPAWQYLSVIFLAIPFTLFYNWFASVMRAVGDSRTPFLYLTAASLLNVLLDCLFIMVFRWGVPGAAAATALSQAASAFLCLRALRHRFPLLAISPQEWSFRADESRRLLAMGIPMGLQWSVIAVGSMVMQGANNSLGTVCVAAYTAASRLKQFALCPFDAIATAVSAFVAQNYGASRMERIREGLRRATLAAVLYGFCAGVLLLVFARPLNRIFLAGTQGSEMELAVLCLRRLGCGLWLLGITNGCRAGLQGTGFAGRAMGTSLVSMAARILVCLCFVGTFGFGAITWADQAAWLAGAAVSLPVLRHALQEAGRRLEADAAEKGD